MANNIAKTIVKGILGDRNVARIRNTRNVLKKKRINIIIDITNVCNLDCIFCPRDNTKPVRMKTQEFDLIMSKVQEHTRSLLLSCTWEFSMAKNAPDVVRLLGRYDFPKTIYTNGNLMSEDLLSAVVEARITNFVFSIGETSKETYERMRKGANFELLMANIRHLHELKKNLNSEYPRICTNLTLLNSNIGELEGYIDLAHEMGVQEVRGRHLILNKELDIGNEVIQDKDYANSVIEAADKKAKAYGMTFSIPKFLEQVKLKECRAPWNQLYISSNGDVSVCPRINVYTKVGNLIDESMNRVMKSHGLADLKNQFKRGDFKNPVCKICMEGKEEEIAINQGF